MADNIVVSYKAVPEGFDKVNASVKSVTNETKTLQKQIQQTFSDKSIEEATLALYEQGDVMGALITRYGDASKAMKAMDKELATMAALGQRNTKEYRELAKATAELKDTIGDTRGEIKKMASDTRIIDTVSQGVRGMAAAFSVVAGTAAQFGVENKELEKTMLRVQGAMTTLQGVQELANLATEKGGIATKAYGVALEVVDKISKATGISMQASWALATAGISIVITTIGYLIYSLQDAEEETISLTEAQKDSRDELQKLQIEYELTIGLIDDYTAATRLLRVETDRSLEDVKQETDKKLGEVQGSWTKNLFQIFNLAGLWYTRTATKTAEILEDGKKKEDDINARWRARQDLIEAQNQKRKEEQRKRDAEREIREAEEKFRKLREIETGKRVDELPAYKLPEKQKELLVNSVKSLNDGVQEEIKKLPPLELPPLQPLGDEEMQQQALIELQTFLGQYSEAIHQTVAGITNIINQATALRTQEVQTNAQLQYDALQQQYDRSVEAAGNNAAKRKRLDEKYAADKKKIDRELAINQAKINRDQAIANKALALVNVAVSIAEAVAKYAGQGPAGYVQIALAVALGAAQTAIISATPIPDVPKFEDGGPVARAGGRIDNGYLRGRSHREGGILIEAQGGEYIWNREATQRHGDIIKAANENRIEDLILHKYVVPAMREKANAVNETYDDWLLRSVIKQGQKLERKNAEFIAAKVSESVSEAIYSQNRYR